MCFIYIWIVNVENPLGFIFSLGLFGLTMIGFSMLITVFFKGKMSAYIGTMIGIGFMFLEISKYGSINSIMEANSKSEPTMQAQDYILYALPFKYIITLSKYYLSKQEINVSENNIALAILSFLYYSLFFYLNQVLPNEFGIKKEFLFCFRKKRNGNYNRINDEEDTNPSISFKNVVMQFGNVNALDDVSIKF
jgi:hypothetical protein